MDQLTPAQCAEWSSRLGTELLISQALPICETNAIAEELRDFAAGIRGESMVAVSGSAGAKAVQLAEHIMAEIALNAFTLPRRSKNEETREQVLAPLRKAA